MIKLMLGDCLERMKEIPGGSVDCILTDLPYGTTQNHWDSVIPFELLWAHYKRIIKPSGAIVLFGSQPFTSALVMSNLKWFKYDWIWKKPKGTGHLNAKKQPMRDKEDVLIFYNSKPTYNPQFSIGTPYKEKSGKKKSEVYGADNRKGNSSSGNRYPKQVLEFGVVERGTINSTQKPVPLLEYLIKTYSNEGEIILDSCFGSASTGIACLNTGRKFIGIEKDSEQFYAGKNRIEAAQLQKDVA
ncbi:MAG: site-specific DNA-methyltransferase [Methylococcaceae bacterium]|jgi:site-specific DNA-methyltransferase (adenine-specific)